MRLIRLAKVVFIIIRCRYWLRGNSIDRLGFAKYTAIRALLLTAKFTYSLIKYDWMPSINDQEEYK